ncbi:hypothetical protein RHGRI_014571 [Rhododendron griersonianum]|uniref:Glycosyl transferase family 28 C-terminal domain-containing protein n=1 Tax=Rhododendron griersonianum TaxID=479676 RepID=A0AAV6K9U1_9ERIC|nr:hypothetical protein RHGRI_014571 [Rhododendron griersonianum]KAG5549257.1 hypothetical protein RHGRI_014571 [Rhododendron griersonianum]
MENLISMPWFNSRDVTNSRFFDLVSPNSSRQFHCNIQAASSSSDVKSYIEKGGDYIDDGEFQVDGRSARGGQQAIADVYAEALNASSSGSIFETLRLRKPLIVVVNEDLMDNHQSELAEELADRKHLFCASPQMLLHTITSMSLESLIPYHPGDARPVAKLINQFLGFSDD